MPPPPPFTTQPLGLACQAECALLCLMSFSAHVHGKPKVHFLSPDIPQLMTDKKWRINPLTLQWNPPGAADPELPLRNWLESVSSLAPLLSLSLPNPHQGFLQLLHNQSACIWIFVPEPSSEGTQIKPICSSCLERKKKKGDQHQHRISSTLTFDWGPQGNPQLKNARERQCQQKQMPSFWKYSAQVLAGHLIWSEFVPAAKWNCPALAVWKRGWRRKWDSSILPLFGILCSFLPPPP